MRAMCMIVVALGACGGGMMINGDDDSTVDASTATDGRAPDAPEGLPTAAELLAKLATCTSIGGPYSIDASEPATVSICSATNAVFWTADLDVDCDGVMSTQCNST